MWRVALLMLLAMPAGAECWWMVGREVEVHTEGFSPAASYEMRAGGDPVKLPVLVPMVAACGPSTRGVDVKALARDGSVLASASASIVCPARSIDYDGDSKVGIGDFAALARAFARRAKEADLDGDGDADLSDFAVFGAGFGCSELGREITR